MRRWLALLVVAGACALGGRGGDADVDGVYDRTDACPATPTGAVVNAQGCPDDADVDGVLNGLDRCPNTPNGVIPDRDGCPQDADGDRVYDGLDQCPASPAGTGVDAHGCTPDGDGDGVPDGTDRCPGTPPARVVDRAGCEPPPPPLPTPAAPPPAPVPVLFTPQRTSVTLRGVSFETGKSRLVPASYAVLDGVAAALRAEPEIRVEVAGHTDNTGTAVTNLQLSEARAAAVRAYLAGRGVAPDRMVARGYGSTMPVGSNSTTAGRAQNRRVELHRIDD